MICKKKGFKIFEVKSRLNCDYVIINLNINKYIKLVQIKIFQLNYVIIIIII